MSKFTVYTDKQNEFRWKFAANDNTVIAKSSQGYKAKEDCLTSLTLLQKDITGAAVDHEIRAAAPQGSFAPAIGASSPVQGAVSAPAHAASPVVSPAPVVGLKN
jgi:uncharacterized protein YegP (UPF0339 family)